MWNERRIAVVIPAFDEEARIARVVRRIPEWVDVIVVVDDASRDDTAGAARRTFDPRLTVVRHATNRGVGAAIVTGYREALAQGAFVLAVMAGDDQMDPADLPSLVDAVVRGTADYAKGDRFRHRERARMPLPRRIAGKLLAFATRAVTGLGVDDTQCGYTALAAPVARALPLDDLWPRYGYPNDLLALLALEGAAVTEVPVRPVYAGERSGVRPWHAVLVLALLARRFPALRSRRGDVGGLAKHPHLRPVREQAPRFVPHVDAG